MRTLINLILDHFLRSQNIEKIEMWRILSFVLLMAGGGSGLFFLFEALIPIMGYVESGISISVLLLLVGGLLLFLNRQKTFASSKPSLSQIQDVFKNLNLESELQNNAGKIMLLSFGIGIALSQYPRIKKFADLYKLLK
ncbi:MAG: hypothetical protein K2W92_08255 [Alphaproteobacteria bacterium]|nr:hypothetical protein [Alphaproteobacteria bacterium]